MKDDNAKVIGGTIRYDNIDLMEAIAMLLVIIYHADIIFIDIISNPGAETTINYLIRPILSVCVPLFYFCNGFLLIDKPFNLKKHIFKMIRFCILGIIWALIDSFAVMAITGEWMGIKDFLHAVWDMKIGWDHHLWFLGALVCFYIFFPLIKAAYDKSSKYLNYWVLICVIFIMGNRTVLAVLRALGSLVTGRSLFITDNIFHIINPFVGIYSQPFLYCSIGCWFGANREKISEWISRKKFICTGTLIAAIVVSTLLLGLEGFIISKNSGIVYDIVFDGYETVFTAVNTICVYILCLKYRNKGNAFGKYIQTVSKSSFGIYLMHIIFIAIFQILASGKRFLMNFPAAIVAALIILNICLVIVIIMKKIPLIRKLVS